MMGVHCYIYIYCFAIAINHLCETKADHMGREVAYIAAASKAKRRRLRLVVFVADIT